MCATSIGFTFSQMPVPGERKSGMPDGTEMPAPVSTTADRASRSSSARRVAWSCAVASGHARYFPLNFGVRLPRKAPMPSFASSDPNAVAKPARLGLRPSSSSPVARHLLDLLDRERRLLGELARPRQRRVEQLVVRHHLVHEPEPSRLVRADRVAEQVHLERLGLADQPRQPLGAAEARDDPEVDLRLAERGRLRGDAEVAGHRQLAAAAERQRVHRGDRDRRGLLHPAHERVRGLEQLLALARGPSS